MYQQVALTPLVFNLQGGRISVAGSGNHEWPEEREMWMRPLDKSTFPLTLAAFADLDLRNRVHPQTCTLMSHNLHRRVAI